MNDHKGSNYNNTILSHLPFLASLSGGRISVPVRVLVTMTLCGDASIGVGVVVSVSVFSGCCSGTMFRWLLLRWSCPFGVSTAYDLGCPADDTTRPRIGSLSEVTHTSVSSGISV